MPNKKDRPTKRKPNTQKYDPLRRGRGRVTQPGIQKLLAIRVPNEETYQRILTALPDLTQRTAILLAIVSPTAP